ncbi:MAG: adenylyltransferase/cytidyltransferase family protein [Candidatus Spechtbacterales bacterium]
MQKKEIKSKKIIVAVSGGWDPVHIGHVRLFAEAKELGDELVVILNNDNWIKAKKGYAFMPEGERKEVLEAFGAVDRVMLTGHPKNPTDMSVSSELRILKPDVFANGGDRKTHNTPEDIVCAELGIKMAFNVGRGGKVQSSSWLVDKHRKQPKGS